MRMMLLMAGTVFAAAAVPTLPVQAAPSGSYLRSCNAVRDEGRGQMSAQCRSVNGRYRYSSLDYRGCRGDIGNNDGQLFCTGGRPGDGPGNGWSGGDRPGRGGGDNGGRLPGGTWQRTCRNIDMRGPVVIAQCQGVGGRWYDTRFDARSCRSDRLANRDGRLGCD